MNDVLRITARIHERINCTRGKSRADFVVILTFDDGNTQTFCTDRIDWIPLFVVDGLHVGS